MSVLFQPVETLAKTASVDELVERVKIATSPSASEAGAEALLCAVAEPSVTVRDALALYFDKLAVEDLRAKSPDQAAKWRLPKERAVENFVALCRNLAMDKIDQSHGRAFYRWRGERLHPADGSTSMKPNSANRDLGNLRKLFGSIGPMEGRRAA